MNQSIKTISVLSLILTTLLLFSAGTVFASPDASSFPNQHGITDFLEIDLANSDTSLTGTEASKWTDYYTYSSGVLTIKQNSPSGEGGGAPPIEYIKQEATQ